jgi:2-iminobutanoate/2-iminopropanoate deaminase
LEKLTMLDPKSVPLSPAIAVGDLLFLSGQIAFGQDGTMVGHDITSQTHQVFRNIAAVLTTHGASLENVVNATVYLTDPDDFAAFNMVYASYFPGIPPARTTVVAGLLAGARVEVTVVARKIYTVIAPGSD